jgi:hypothetical protein
MRSGADATTLHEVLNPVMLPTHFLIENSKFRIVIHCHVSVPPARTAAGAGLVEYSRIFMSRH